MRVSALSVAVLDRDLVELALRHRLILTALYFGDLLEVERAVCDHVLTIGEGVKRHREHAADPARTTGKSVLRDPPEVPTHAWSRANDLRPKGAPAEH